jgi:PBP4 family serine-type D-alanyl-D-alanine carboxypeptidase
MRVGQSGDMKSPFTSLCVILSLLLAVSIPGAAAQSFARKVEEVTHRPAFAHSFLGIAVYSLDTHKVVFSFNGDKFFTPGSTAKLLTEGTALQVLGPSYRFRTRIYRTGRISDGKLRGDLVLVASGDPNLSDRVQADDTLAFMDEDHSYSGHDARLVPGDPALLMKQFAAQIKSAGIRKVQGRVLVDVSLFPEGDRDLPSGTVISPISVNDNLIDITITSGPTPGAPTEMTYSPGVPYIRFVDKVVTAADGSLRADINAHTDSNAAEVQTVTLTGTLPRGESPYIFSYAVSSPSRFAAALLLQSLEETGIEVEYHGRRSATVTSERKRFYTPENLVAVHVSAPLAQEVTLTLKVSQNLHASMMPYILGALARAATGDAATGDAETTGFRVEHDLLSKAGLDLGAASQADGAGGAASFTPIFMTSYLAYMSQQNNFTIFKEALPVLGRDGTLANMLRDSPAAGYVFAKTGTLVDADLLNKRFLVLGKGLAGYTTSPAGEHLAFALYLNYAPVPGEEDQANLIAGTALGEIAAAAHLLPIDDPTLTASK